MTDRDPNDAIRAWFQEGPSRGTERGLEETLERLAGTAQGSGRELRLPIWVPAAAVVAVLLAGAIAFGAGFRITRNDAITPVAPSPSQSGCRLDVPVGGMHGFIIGTGFAPNTDVTIEITRGDGSQITLDRGYNAALHTDRHGAFGVEVRPYDADLGHEVLVAHGGCDASLDVVVTAEDLPPACPDPAIRSTPVVDGPAYRAAVAADSPIDWWHFDDTNGVASDSAGAHQGTYVGSIVPAVRSPLSDGGSTFFHHQFPDDTNITLPEPITLAGDFTIEAWVLMCHYPDDGDAIVGSADSAPSLNFGGALLHVDSGLGQVASVDSQVESLVWQHWVLTRRDGALQLYRDGTPDGWGLESNWRMPFPIGFIGRDSVGDNLLGYLDELALYDHALSPERVAAHAHP